MPEPTVREMLLQQIDEHLKVVAQGIEHIRALTEQLEPDRAESCATAIALTGVCLDDIKLRAHAELGRLDEQG